MNLFRLQYKAHNFDSLIHFSLEKPGLKGLCFCCRISLNYKRSVEFNDARDKYNEINLVKISVAHSETGHMQGSFVRKTKQKIKPICVYMTFLLDF